MNMIILLTDYTSFFNDARSELVRQKGRLACRIRISHHIVIVAIYYICSSSKPHLSLMLRS